MVSYQNQEMQFLIDKRCVLLQTQECLVSVLVGFESYDLPLFCGILCKYILLTQQSVSLKLRT